MADNSAQAITAGKISSLRIQSERGTVNVVVRCLLNYGPESRSCIALDVTVEPAEQAQRNNDEAAIDKAALEEQLSSLKKEEQAAEEAVNAIAAQHEDNEDAGKEKSKELEQAQQRLSEVRSSIAELEAKLGKTADQGSERQRPTPWNGSFYVYDVYDFIRSMTKVATLQDVRERFIDRGTVMFINNAMSERYGVSGNIVFYSRQSNRRTAMLLPPNVAYDLLSMIRPYVSQMPVQLPVQISTRTRPRYSNGNIIRVNGSVILAGQGSETVSLSKRDVDWIRFAVGSMTLASDSKRSISAPGGYSLNLANKIVQIPRARIRFNGEDAVRLASTIL